jgi:glycosyltransferase involved in cell wall biosynthesis
MARNVLCVAEYGPDVGYAWWLMESLWIELAALCAESGLGCVLAYPSKGRVPERIARAPIEVVFADFSAASSSSLTTSCRGLRQLNVDVVYLSGRPFFDPVYAAWRASGVTTIVSHDHNPGDRPPVRGVKGALKGLRNRFGPATCDLVIALSPWMRERALRSGRIPGSRCRVVQNGIPPINCQSEGTSALRSELGFGTDAILVVSVGRAHPYKNIEFVVDVAAELQNRGTAGVRFLHVGDGPGMDNIRRHASARGVLDSLFFLLGRRDDVRQVLCDCDIGLHSAYGEGFSLAILEYMSAGLAVMVPDIESVRQSVRENETGLVYPPGDARHVADLVVALSRSPERLAKLGRAASDTVRAEYSFERTRREFRDVMAPFL